MCDLCYSGTPTRHISLFVFGSEGLNVCHECEMKLVGYARVLRVAYMTDDIANERKCFHEIVSVLASWVTETESDICEE